jgi:hypothetical protein
MKEEKKWVLDESHVTYLNSMFQWVLLAHEVLHTVVKRPQLMRKERKLHPFQTWLTVPVFNEQEKIKLCDDRNASAGGSEHARAPNTQ